MRASDMAGQHEYWNAAGLLVVHAGIAYADAITIGLSGLKSTSPNHLDVLDLLREVVRQGKGRDAALGHLKAILEEKNRVSYTGQSFHSSDAESLAFHAGRFRAWALPLVQSRS